MGYLIYCKFTVKSDGKKSEKFGKVTGKNNCLQCFDTVGQASGRASGLSKIE